MKKLVYIFLLLLIGISSLSLTLSSKEGRGFIEKLQEKLHLFNSRMVEEKVYLHTDKTIYKPSEVIWFSAYLRSNSSPSNVSNILYVELISPKGDVAKKLTLPVNKGFSRGDFLIKEDWTGGIYKLRAYTAWMKNFPKDVVFEKEITVQKVITPRVLMKLDFNEEAYGAGDIVNASFKLRNLQNDAITQHNFKYQISIDGKINQNLEGKTDDEGSALLSFKLPEQLNSNDGLLLVKISYKNQIESISRSIPIVLNKITLQFFPEGGELITSVSSNVGFKALNEFGKPADIEVELLEDGNPIATFKSFHQGMGAFKIKPGINKQYTARITRPKGVAKTFDLPQAKNHGMLIAVDSCTNDKLYVRVYNSQPTQTYLTLVLHNELVYSKKVEVKTGWTHHSIETPDFFSGLAILTLFDNKEFARSERLVFINPQKQLKINITSNKEKYAPREKVKMTIKTRDNENKPISARVSLAVVDDKIITLADDKQDNILSYLLLSSEVKGKIYEPNFYFDPKEKKAPQALDYLLMTQGWRRFTWKEIKNSDFSYKFYPEKTGTVIGQVINRYSQKGVQANVTLMELGKNRRAAQIKTSANGNFVFFDVDPSVTIRLIADARLKNNDNLVIKLQNKVDNNLLSNGDNRNKGGNKNTQHQDLLKQILELPIVESEDPNKESIQNNISLKASEEALEEVVVVGYGSQKKSSITGSIAHVTGEDLLNNYSMNVADAISGVIPGVTVFEDAGSPEYNSQILIRGTNSVVNNSPLYVIDGVVIGENISDIFAQDGLLSANDIKSISVLKSPQANAIFGARGANGVVLIETNKPKMRGNQILLEKRYASLTIAPTRNFNYVREFYAPDYSKNNQSAERTDFRQTIYWNPAVKTNENGKATVEFYNSDDITTFKAIAEGIGSDNSIGRAKYNFYTQLPFSMDVKIPPYVVFGDTLCLQVTLANNSKQNISGSLLVSAPIGLTVFDNENKQIIIPANNVSKHTVKIAVENRTLKDYLSIHFKSDKFSDRVKREIEALPIGFPVHISRSGKALENQYNFTIKQPVPGSVKAKFTAYPNIMDDLLSGIESILREPYGCFEQTSASTYPNIMVLQYLKETNQVNPELEKKALNLIKKGYKRLIGFETSEGGFEWFGRTPPHEGLTAYGLVEFIDMKEVYKGVDQNLIDRTREWLLDRRDGNGDFKFREGGLDQFRNLSQITTNAYLVYALSESGVSYNELKNEFTKAYSEAMNNKDAYRLSLLANAAFNFNKVAIGNELLHELKRLYVKHSMKALPSETSIVNSGGKSLQIETISLLVMTLLKSDIPDSKMLYDAVDFISNSRSYGGFGSTQATILALTALTDFAKYAKRTSEPGIIQLALDGNLIAHKRFQSEEQGPFVFDNLEKDLLEKKHQFEVRFKEVSEAFPYTLDISYTTYTPINSSNCALKIDTKIHNPSAHLAENVRLSTTIVNLTSNQQPMTMALIGIPGGLSPQAWQLKELQEKRLFDFYEIFKNYVVLYFTRMEPGEEKTIHLDLKAEVPGRYLAPASCTYLYYTNEYKNWTKGVQVEIKE
ncbi:MAG: TonB-dependent receptor plug domain-containing protein [Bacteroidales bacterium]|nr:TonB-dependent receptor plug domain-containing protein [Bacteroidales bacterium]